jgi:hypothetical protein
MLLVVSGKCSDLCFCTALDDDDKLMFDHDGYVPYGIGVGGGDYIELTIDVATGTIQGWNAKSVINVLQKLSGRQ